MSRFASVTTLAVIAVLASGAVPPEDFSPEGCDYAVTFPRSYRTYTVDQTSVDGSIVSVIHGASTNTNDGKMGYKAECGAVEYDIEALTQEEMRPALTQIAAALGLSMPSYEWDESSLGKVATITGRRGNPLNPTMIQVINYHGRSSIMTVYIISEAQYFITQPFLDFKNSVRLR